VNVGRFRVELLFLVAGLAIGVGCNSTLFDAAGVPAVGALVCTTPETHACEAIRLCKADDDASFCEASCHRCDTAVAGAKAICSANRCTYECPAGLLKCADGCCPAVAVSAGGDHACAITDRTGELLCWGANNDGQLGIGYDPSLPVPPDTGIDQATPVKVALPGRAVAVGAGGAHSCAVLDTGAVWCWGRKSSYAGGKDYDFAPVEVPDLAGATAVASGGAHSCFITAGRAVRCVGSWDPVGAITNGLPVASGATALTAGDDFTCAIVESAPGAGDGAVRCWGANDHAQLGGGVSGTIAQPVSVPLGPPVIAIGAGVHHTCASTPAGPLRCWSSKRVGTTSDPDPYRPDGVDFAATAVAGGQMHTCAVPSGARDGVACWGQDVVPPVVVGGAPASSGALVHVPFAEPVVALVAGDFHTCALAADGRVACWGEGARGQLGDGRKADSAAPVFVISR
jgi:Regulator of Chromosome Condensation (RCC1) repeat protein/regulator of chromosome condensation (RCC1) repeat-containing protein